MNHGRYRGKKTAYCKEHHKVRYKTRKDAKRARAHMLTKERNTYLRVYKCPDCRGYHLTSQYVDWEAYLPD